MRKPKIFLIDDHRIFCEGLQCLIMTDGRYEVVGACNESAKALNEVKKTKPDIIVLDISMPSISGIEIARQIRKTEMNMRIVMLSQHDNECHIVELLKIGINGYVLKENASGDLMKAIEEALKGNCFLSPRLTNRILKGFLSRHCIDNTTDTEEIEESHHSGYLSLTTRELQIAKMIAEGQASNDIAQNLCVSEKTIKAHRANIMKKLDIHKVADLIKFAIKNNLVEY